MAIEEFDWDEGNKIKNKLKHGVTKKESEHVFLDKHAVQFEDIKHSQVERRIIIIGKSKRNRHLHITFTIRRNKIRVISARDANKKEREYYENQ